MRIHRLISILFLIEKNNIIKAKRLANELEVSTRTIYRDIDILCEAGFPLYSTTGPNGGIQFSNHFTLGVRSLNEDDLLPVIISSLRISPDIHTNLATQINENIKVIKEMLDSTDNVNNSINEKIYIDQESWWGDMRNRFPLKIIIDALWQLKILNILYCKKDGTKTAREINPYGLILKDSTWYLVGLCHWTQSLRTFDAKIFNMQRV